MMCITMILTTVIIAIASAVTMSVHDLLAQVLAAALAAVADGDSYLPVPGQHKKLRGLNLDSNILSSVVWGDP